MGVVGDDLGRALVEDTALVAGGNLEAQLCCTTLAGGCIDGETQDDRDCGAPERKMGDRHGTLLILVARRSGPARAADRGEAVVASDAGGGATVNANDYISVSAGETVFPIGVMRGLSSVWCRPRHSLAAGSTTRDRHVRR